MKVAELLESRRQNWKALEHLCLMMERPNHGRMGAEQMLRFGSLYRAACADLALADSYQLPPNTVFYLHSLVGRAHNQLYRSRIFKFRQWGKSLFYDVPQSLFKDRCLRLATVLFWGVFLASMFMASRDPQFAYYIVGDATIEQMEEMYASPVEGRDASMSSTAMGFYVWHNTSIGLECLAFGLFFGVGGLPVVTFNAAVLGAVFGYMTHSAGKVNFFQFVTAHGPFELTAIVLCAGAGMRLGFALVDTHGMSRGASLRQAGREVLPMAGAAIVMFALAALIEGFLSPSAAPYAVKAAVAVISTLLLLFYFVVLGWPRGAAHATG